MFERIPRLCGVVFVVATLASGGCAVMPASGPSSLQFEAEASPTVPYALVKLDPQTVAILSTFEPATLAGTFVDDRPPAPVKFGVGDSVSVTVFESAAGGLFIPIEAGVRPGNFVTLPDQTVDNDGNISVPYAGTVRAAGRTNVDIQSDIVSRIRNRAIEPQVIVALSQQRTSLVSVFGEVGNSVRYPAPGVGAGDRITDAITRAGGIRGQGFETWVTLERDGRRATVPFANLIYAPANDIYVRPGDRIYVYREPQRFIAFGASGQQGSFNFDAWRINLADAVAKAGGLIDGQADPGAVFLYRREPREIAKRLGVDVDRFEGDLVPVIFSISFRDPGSYFVATKLQMRNADVIFVANAASVEITKFLQFLNVIMATTSNAVFVREDIKTTMRR